MILKLRMLVLDFILFASGPAVLGQLEGQYIMKNSEGFYVSVYQESSNTP